MEIPPGYFADIRPRSSSNSMGLHVYHGTIDENYRGPLFAFVQNMSSDDILIESGQRLVQIILHKKIDFYIEEVDELSASVRGESGFGSSGKF